MTTDRRSLLRAALALPAATALPGARAATTAQADADANAPDLGGVSVLVTGCSSGFGYLGALHYGALGAKVFATMRRTPRPEADALRRAGDEAGLDLTILDLDVTDDDSVAAAVADAEEAAGGALDVVVNNAGISYGGPIEMQDMAATRHLFDTNVFGPHRLARAALPAMRAAGRGHIVNVSSQLGRVIVPGFGQYSPTKFALEAMSEQMAYEVAGHGVAVTIIEPGGYPTDIWANARALTDDLLARTPDAMQDAYAGYLAAMAGRGEASTDPMDVPRAIAAAIAAPPTKRSLRVAVHPTARPQEAINEASEATQRRLLAGMGMERTARAVFGG